jgi:hypothetical protein
MTAKGERRLHYSAVVSPERCSGPGTLGGMDFRRRPGWWTVLGAAAVVVYAWVAAGFRPFTTREEVLVAIPALAGLVAVGWGARRPRPPSQSQRSRGSAAIWIGLVVAATAWELSAFFSSPRSDHPTLSVIADDIMSVRPGRALMFLLWLGLGWVLVRDPRAVRR